MWGRFVLRHVKQFHAYIALAWIVCVCECVWVCCVRMCNWKSIAMCLWGELWVVTLYSVSLSLFVLICVTLHAQCEWDCVCMCSLVTTKNTCWLWLWNVFRVCGRGRRARWRAILVQVPANRRRIWRRFKGNKRKRNAGYGSWIFNAFQSEVVLLNGFGCLRQ